MPERVQPDRRSPALVLAALVATEAAAVLVGCLALVVLTIRDPPKAWVGQVFLVVIGAALAVGLALCARAVLRGERWPTSAIFTWQVLQAGVGFTTTDAAWWHVGVLLIAVAAVGLVLTLLRSGAPGSPGSPD